LGTYAEIDLNRIQNVTVSCLSGCESGSSSKKFKFLAKFTLNQHFDDWDEPSNDRVISRMTYDISLNVFFFWIGPTMMKGMGIQEKPIQSDEGNDKYHLLDQITIFIG
jgi:hypothetical protein